MKAFSLNITASDQVFFDGECQFLVIPSFDGELGIMANHQRMTATVENGTLRYQTMDGEWHFARVSDGLAEIEDNHVNVIVLFAVRPEEFEHYQAQTDYDRALEEILHKQSIQEYEQSKAQLARALSRLKRENQDSGIGE